MTACILSLSKPRPRSGRAAPLRPQTRDSRDTGKYLPSRPQGRLRAPCARVLLRTHPSLLRPSRPPLWWRRRRRVLRVRRDHHRQEVLARPPLEPVRPRHPRDRPPQVPVHVLRHVASSGPWRPQAEADRGQRRRHRRIVVGPGLLQARRLEGRDARHGAGGGSESLRGSQHPGALLRHAQRSRSPRRLALSHGPRAGRPSPPPRHPGDPAPGVPRPRLRPVGEDADEGLPHAWDLQRAQRPSRHGHLADPHQGHHPHDVRGDGSRGAPPPAEEPGREGGRGRRRQGRARRQAEAAQAPRGPCRRHPRGGGPTGGPCGRT